MKLFWKILLAVLFLIVLTVWTAALTFPDKKLALVACDVGQGDAILTTYGSFQILTDGGLPNNKVSECLSRYVPFWDRTIEVVVSTHPQLDHYGGLIKVLETYNVHFLLANPLESSTKEYQVLKELVGRRGVSVLTPDDGLKLRYGLISYDILFPDYDFLINEGWSGEKGKLGNFVSKRDPNDFSIQAHLRFRNFDALLTGDIGNKMETYVAPQLEKIDVEYIKVPHHGSKNALTNFYIDYFDPEVAVIQVGKNNYGHPTAEILKLLSDAKVRVYRNDLHGDIVLKTDGETYEVFLENAEKR